MGAYDPMLSSYPCPVPYLSLSFDLVLSNLGHIWVTSGHVKLGSGSGLQVYGVTSAWDGDV